MYCPLSLLNIYVFIRCFWWDTRLDTASKLHTIYVGKVGTKTPLKLPSKSIRSNRQYSKQLPALTTWRLFFTFFQTKYYPFVRQVPLSLFFRSHLKRSRKLCNRWRFTIFSKNSTKEKKNYIVKVINRLSSVWIEGVGAACLQGPSKPKKIYCLKNRKNSQIVNATIAYCFTCYLFMS